MSTIQTNEETVRKIFEQSLNKRNMILLQELISPGFTGPRGEKGAAGFEAPVVLLIKAAPDVQWHIQELVGEGNKVVARWKLEGTHTGQFQNMAPTGKTFSNDGMGIFELKNGKVTSGQVHTDRLGFLQQLGALPTDLTSLYSLYNKKDHQNSVRFIDKFFVPAAARKEFSERMSINRDLIKTMPGFIDDAAYIYTDDKDNLICITIAQWESREAMDKAKEAVQASYKQEGFDLAEMFTRLNISVDRGIYSMVEDH